MREQSKVEFLKLLRSTKADKLSFGRIEGEVIGRHPGMEITRKSFDELNKKKLRGRRPMNTCLDIISKEVACSPMDGE